MGYVIAEEEIFTVSPPITGILKETFRKESNSGKHEQMMNAIALPYKNVFFRLSSEI